MFTNKYNRRAEQPSQSRNSKYIEPFAEPETAAYQAGRAAAQGFMAELDQWLDESVFAPIENAITAGDTKELHLAFNQAKLLLKRKVLASYHNGLKAKPPTINHNANDKPHYHRN